MLREESVRYELDGLDVVTEIERFLIAWPQVWSNSNIQVHWGYGLHPFVQAGCWYAVMSATEEPSQLSSQCKCHTIASLILFLLFQHLIHRNTPLAQIRLGQFDLFEKFLVRFGLVLESVDAVAEFAQEVCAKGDEGPEGKL